MFKVIINDGTQKLPDDDIFYVIAKEGIFLKKKMGIMESLAPVKGISILQSITGMARMHINPLPAVTGAKVLDFFRKVYVKHRAEAVVILFYNETTGKYKVVAPEQKVTAASLSYKRDMQFDGFSMIGTIHSHASMSAFHSGIDTDDEKAFDGLHITYGHMASDDFSLSASIVANGSRFMVNPEEYMLGLIKTKDIDEQRSSYATKVYRWNGEKMVLDEKASKKSTYTTRFVDRRFIFNVPPSKSQSNPKWMDNVEYGWAGYSYGNSMYGGFDWTYGNGYRNQRNPRSYKTGWGSRYDPSAWNQVGRNAGNNLPVVVPPGGQKSPLNVGPSSKVVPVQFPKHNQPPCDPTRPCLTCEHRDIKMLEELDDVDYEDELFICEKCQAIIQSDDFEVVCPTCKTDKYLSAIDTSNLESNYKYDPKTKTKEPFLQRKPADYLNSAQSMYQPDQHGMIKCLACGEKFLLLEGDEHCPFCKTLLPTTPPVDEQEWECPYCQGVFGESEMLDAYHCPHCQGRIDISCGAFDYSSDKEVLICPNCQLENTIASIEALGCCYSCGSPAIGFGGKELDNIKTTQLDSGTYIKPDEEKALLDAAAEVDKNLERIPDPERTGSQGTPLTAAEKIRSAMSKVFGGKDNGTIH